MRVQNQQKQRVLDKKMMKNSEVGWQARKMLFFRRQLILFWKQSKNLINCVCITIQRQGSMQLFKKAQLQYNLLIKFDTDRQSPKMQNTPGRRQQQSNNDSISSFESIINELSPQQSKFCSVFIENWELFIAKIHSCQVFGSHHLFGNKFVKYKIKVVTDHVCYFIEKRYRDFEHLYQKVSTFFHPQTSFPRKTHLKSKTCPFLTQQRKQAFDNLISQLISLRNKNKSVVSELLSFLDVKRHYEEQGLDQKIYQVQNVYQYMNQIANQKNIFGILLRHQILKMNLVRNKSLHYLQKIEGLLVSANRGLVKSQDLKVLIVGFNKNPGILQTALSKDNTTVTLILLKFLKKLINPQQCPYSQTMRKILSTLQPHNLILTHPQLLSNEEVQSQYFDLLDLYTKMRTNIENEQKKQELLGQILKHQTLEKYQNWKKYRNQVQFLKRRKSKLELYHIGEIGDNEGKGDKGDKEELKDSQRSLASSEAEDQIDDGQQEEFFCHQVQRLLAENWEKQKQMEKEQKGEFFQYQELWRNGNNYCEVNKNKNKKLMHFSLTSIKNIEDIVTIFKKWGHNKLVSSYYPSNKITNINRIFFSFEGKPERLFQFEEHTSQTDTTFTVKMQPPKALKCQNTFFYRVRITQSPPASLAPEYGTSPSQQVKIDLVYYFPNKKVSKLFQNEHSGKSRIMWESLEDIFENKKQVSSFGSTSATIDEVSIL